MSRLSSLLRQVAERDPRLAEDLEREVSALSQRRHFGLNFERHVPETVELYGRPIRKGDKVRLLAGRGEPAKSVDSSLRIVTGIKREGGVRIAQLVPADPTVADADPAERPVDDLVVVAEFRDPIFPGLLSTGKVERRDDKPFHTVINAENFHALQLLRYTHEGKVDAIYIDPPYNTGAKDWKYSNDYVDSDDAYRHSKWLAMMERRLRLARRLLKPEESVLIVTVDEKECLRLGLLLQQVFPEADIQMISAVINRAGSPRTGRFARVDEYIFTVFVGSARVAPWTSTMLADDEETSTMPTVWFTAVRRGSGAGREDKKSGKASFYPVVIDSESGAFIRVGDPVPHGVSRHDVELADGEIAIWPLGKDGRENRWRFSADVMRRYFAEGTARLGKRDPATGLRPVTYLQPGTLKNIEKGIFTVRGRSAEGALELSLGEQAKAVVPRTVWNRTSHFARDHGSHLLAALVPGRRFPFPKSLYAVEDVLRFFVADKPDATIVDFFAGSGTTAHATMRLNRQDGGRRQCILVTNNEVSADEQEQLRRQGRRPGDPEWEALGICDYITKPRVTAAVTGMTPEGDPIEGDYRFTDQFPMAEGFEENVEFFTMTYDSFRAVAHHRSFEAVAPVLWLKAGATGRRIEQSVDDFVLADVYAVLFDVDHSRAFLAAVHDAAHLRMVFVITDDDRSFQMVCSELPAGVEPVRLYSSYLSNFMNNGWD